ncbi:MbnP family protein [Pedobacter cryoconitis]|uniref:MbnP family protein n=1 Tax=Pedobacter cryoconitis TaxID=188932 RepID=UPI001617C0D4|nr:MbnP family protein [Pedobacter cryoconitis]MBB5645717.1 hypothetical protein [Pedobacter cryoconitis]
MNKRLILAISAMTLSLFSCKKQDIQIKDSGVNLIFDNVVGSQDLVLNKIFSIEGKIFLFNSVRYWISNVEFIQENGTTYSVPNSYYLVEETDAITIQEGLFSYPAVKREQIAINAVPKGNYKSIRFHVGVDSVKNNNLSLSGGELSPMSGMTNTSWMWYTSYIFSSVKGTMENGTTKLLKAETGLNSNYKTVELTFPKVLLVSDAKDNVVTLKADIVKLLDGVDAWEYPTIGANLPEKMSIISNNFSNKVFTINSIK